MSDSFFSFTNVAKRPDILLCDKPMGASSDWAVYQVINGKAQLKHVTISLRGNEEAIIVGGLQ